MESRFWKYVLKALCQRSKVAAKIGLFDKRAKCCEQFGAQYRCCCASFWCVVRRVLFNHGLISSCIEQFFGLCGISNFDFNDPAVSIGVGVDEGGFVVAVFV